MGITHRVKNQHDKWTENSSGSWRWMQTQEGPFFPLPGSLCLLLHPQGNAWLYHAHIWLAGVYHWLATGHCMSLSLCSRYKCSSIRDFEYNMNMYTLGMYTQLKYAAWPLDGVIILRIAWPTSAAVTVVLIAYCKFTLEARQHICLTAVIMTWTFREVAIFVHYTHNHSNVSTTKSYLHIEKSSSLGHTIKEAFNRKRVHRKNRMQYSDVLYSRISKTQNS